MTKDKFKLKSKLFKDSFNPDSHRSLYKRMAHAGLPQALALAHSVMQALLPLPAGKLNLHQNAVGRVLLLFLMEPAMLACKRKVPSGTQENILSIFSTSFINFFRSLTNI